jgi:transposase
MLDETIITETPPLYSCYCRRGEQAFVPITGNRQKRILHGCLNIRSRYDKLVRKADRLNPPPLVSKAESDDAKKPTAQLTPRRLVNRLQRRRDEVLRFMADSSMPFDNNGSERDLRMVKLQQKISGCFRTADGARNFCRVRSYLSTARKQGHCLLSSLERAFNGKPLVFEPAES